MELIDRLRAWSHSRQRLGRPARSTDEALASVVAVYATHPTAPLALWARTRSFTPAAYRRLDRDRTALRVPAMRGTIFLVPRESAASMFTAVRPPAARVLRSLGRHGISNADYEQLARRILGAARQPRRGEELKAAAGIDGQVLGTVLRCLRYEGRVLAVAGDSLNSSPHGYVATSAWAPGGLDGGDPGEALAWLAGEYLGAYGPARVTDFAWWAGVGKRAAKDALEAHETIEVDEGLRLLSRDAAAFSRVKRLTGSVDVLPKWDAYTMGYAPDGRARLVHPVVQRTVYTPIGVGLAGDANPVVLVDGEAVATWTYTLKDGAAVQPFESLGSTVRRKIDEKLDAVAGLLSNRAVSNGH